MWYDGVMPVVQTQEGPLFVAQRGQQHTTAVPLVCLHGAGGTHQHWGLLLRGLTTSEQARVRVLLPDLPGHGRSPGPGRPRVSDYGSAVVALLDALSLPRAVLVGHSMGGAVALSVALAAPERVAGLALVGTGARLPVMPALFDDLARGDLESAVQRIVEAAYSPTAPAAQRAAGHAAFLQTDPRVFADDLTACAAHNVVNQLGAIACPTLVVCGADDRVTPLRFSHTLQAGIRGAMLVVVPDAGHMVQIEQPNAVVAALQAFLALTCQCRSG